MFRFYVTSDIIKALAITRMNPASPDRAYFNGIFARRDGSNVTLCSSDNYVMSAYTLPATMNGTGDKGYGIIPGNLVDIMARGKKGLQYAVSMNVEEQASEVTIVEMPFLSGTPANTYDARYDGRQVDFMHIMHPWNDPSEPKACVYSFRLIDALKVGKSLFGKDAWSEICECDDGVYIYTHNPKDRSDIVISKVGTVIDSVRRY